MVLKNKKGNLSLQMVIVAIILIIVLAVVLIIFSKHVGSEDEIVKNKITGLSDCFNDESNCDYITDSDSKESGKKTDTNDGKKGR